MDAAREYAFAGDNIEAAIDRCLRALGSIREAEEETAVSSEIVSKRKKTALDQKVAELTQQLWCLTKDISSKTRVCYDQHQKTRVLRVHFLAYCYQPQDGAQAVGG